MKRTCRNLRYIEPIKCVETSWGEELRSGRVWKPQFTIEPRSPTKNIICFGQHKRGTHSKKEPLSRVDLELLYNAWNSRIWIDSNSQASIESDTPHKNISCRSYNTRMRIATFDHHNFQMGNRLNHFRQVFTDGVSMTQPTALSIAPRINLATFWKRQTMTLAAWNHLYFHFFTV